VETPARDKQKAFPMSKPPKSTTWFPDDDRPSLARRQKFVRSLVFFGGAVGVSCGAVSERPEGESDGGGGGPTPQGTGGTRPLATGGTPSATGGTLSTGGQVDVVQTGGRLVVDPDRPVFQWPEFGAAGAAGAPGAFGIFECPPAQLSCTDNGPFCSFNDPLDTTDCSCDPARPSDPSECALGEVFVCNTIAVDTADGRQPAAIACRCSAGEPTCELCGDADSRRADFYDCEMNAPQTQILCGCGYVLLR
jgi:hypothetical protein